jgi:hypothetical protein
VRRIVCLVAVALVSCTGADGAGAGASSAPPSAAATGRDVFVRACESSVSGDLGRRWRAGELAAGPVVFVAARGYADDPARWFGTPRRPRVHKVLLAIRGRAPVEVAVKGDHAALAYDESKWGALSNVMPFRLGDPVVRFEPCGGDQRWTQFNGGFLLRGPACVPVAVRVEGEPADSTTISFGAGRCD